jgi:hypothetical protein
MILTHISANCTSITLANGDELLFSYGTPVAMQRGGKYSRSLVKYSAATSRHIANWLNGVLAQYCLDSDITTFARSI